MADDAECGQYDPIRSYCSTRAGDAQKILGIWIACMRPAFDGSAASRSTHLLLAVSISVCLINSTFVLDNAVMALLSCRRCSSDNWALFGDGGEATVAVVGLA